MKALRINGGKPLKGSITASGSKNAALPMMCAALLTSQPVILRRVPDLQDIKSMERLLGLLGVAIHDTPDEQGRVLQAINVAAQPMAPYELVRTMRASVLVLGPLVARQGWAKVSLPGGCAIGARPIDQHIKGLEQLGVNIELSQGYVIASAKRLRGGRVTFDMATVGGTENLLMAAVLAEGETVIENAAREPEIAALANLLRAMGASIEGDGSSTIYVRGVSSLGGAEATVITDRIETGTYLIAAAATRGSVTVNGGDAAMLEIVLSKLAEAGCQISCQANAITVTAYNSLKAIDIRTAPFPGFPTDLQAQWMTLMTTAEGVAEIVETIFENRFMHVPELIRMGADIKVQGNIAVVRGGQTLTGAPVMATDLRASAGLVIGALAAKGSSDVLRIYHLARGYEKLEQKLRSLGADVEAYDRDATTPHLVDI